jgi:concentrative nucleoside transporter, CNT family
MNRAFRFSLLLALSAVCFFSCKKPPVPLERQIKNAWVFNSAADGELSVQKNDTLVFGQNDFMLQGKGKTIRGAWKINEADNILTLIYELKPTATQIDSLAYAVKDNAASVVYYNEKREISRLTETGLQASRVTKIMRVRYATENQLSFTDGKTNYTADLYVPVLAKKEETGLASRFTGLIGIVLIFGIAFLLSNNKKAINYRLVFSGVGLQLVIALLVLKVAPVTNFFAWLGRGMGKIEQFAAEGAGFVWGGLMVNTHTGIPTDFRTPHTFVFAFSVTATIILVCVLVAIFYHWGIMQRIVAVIAKVMNFVMRASGAEALSNVASAFVGQVEAQVMIRPYLPTMTKSELLSSMAGSMACIAGGILIVYVNMGAKAEYLLTASLMAAPAALVISKIIYPETEESLTKGNVKLEIKKEHTNLVDAISHGAADGMKISINVIAMLIGFIALIAFVNYLLGKIPIGDAHLSLDYIFGKLFYPMAWCMGVPPEDVQQAATIMGQKLTINEFVAFDTLTHKLAKPLSEKGLLITSFAICGFANFSSVGMQIGGIGALVPERRADLAKLGLKALVCGTLASYLSATIAGMLI